MPERVLSSADFDTMESALIVVGGGGMDGGGLLEMRIHL